MHVRFGISFILLPPSLQQYLQASAIIAIMIKAWGNYKMIALSIALVIYCMQVLLFQLHFLLLICSQYATGKQCI